MPSESRFAHWFTPWRAACIGLILLSLLAYLGALNGELVWDDRMLVSGGGIGGGKSLLKCFTEPFIGHFFRPLVSVSFFFERKLWGLNPAGYHATNLLLHAAGTAMMVGLLRQAFGNRIMALLGGAFFALHPASVGAVAWIGGRTDSLVCLWVLLFARGIVGAAQATAGERLKPSLLALLGFTLAIYTKEQTLALLPLAPLAFYCWKSAHEGPPEPLEETDRRARAGAGWLLTGALLAGAALFLWLGGRYGMVRPSGIQTSLPQVLERASHTFSYYTLLLLVPTPTAMHTMSLGAMEKIGWPAAAFGWLAAGGTVALFLIWLRRAPAAAWFIGLIVLSLLPVSNLLPLPFLLVAPYRAAVSTIGLAGVLAWAFRGVGTYIEVVWSLPAEGPIQHRRPRPRPGHRLLACVAGAVLLWQGALTVWGTTQWVTEERFFTNVVAYDPGSIVGKYTLAYRLAALGRYERSALLMEETLDSLYRSKAWQAPESARAAFIADPELRRRTHQNQGSENEPSRWLAQVFADGAWAWMRAGNDERGLRLLRAGEAVRSEEVGINQGFADWEWRQGHVDEAIRRMHRAVADNPWLPYPHSFLGRAHARQGLWARAREELAEWRRLEPDSREAKSELAEAEARLRQTSRK